jgi:phosphoribosylaminoimidazolecarboxamide formyltransferase/IMP cyclohydrolase
MIPSLYLFIYFYLSKNNNIILLMNALISVSDKTGLPKLVQFLSMNNFNIYSTGGTYETIKSYKNVYKISDLTDFPEILNGRVKTLHPKIYGGILATDSIEHRNELKEHHIQQFDLVVVNLYPFKEVSATFPEDTKKCIDNIDIGGVSLIRAASKNHTRVVLLSDPNDYSFYTTHLLNGISHSDRVRFAIKGFNMTSDYDSFIGNYLNSRNCIDLKYGMNPHQGHARITFNDENKAFTLLNGKLGYINVLDALHGYLTVKETDHLLHLPAVASMKHTSLAGLAVGNNISQETLAFFTNSTNVSPISMAFMKARMCDPLSSFGDLICFSREVDYETATLIKKEVCDGVVAPSFNRDALELLKTKKNGNFILIEMDEDYYQKHKQTGWTEKREMYGMTLEQDSNRCETELPMDTPRRSDLILANTALKYAQSNNISFAYDGQVIGMGCGQQNRVDCVKLAGAKAQNWLKRHTSVSLDYWNTLEGKRQEKINKLYDFVNNSSLDIVFSEDLVMASDGFFPFPDNIREAHRFNVKSIIQPGGSVADDAVQKECDKYGISMITTGTRMFYH